MLAGSFSYVLLQKLGMAATLVALRSRKGGSLSARCEGRRSPAVDGSFPQHACVGLRPDTAGHTDRPDLAVPGQEKTGLILPEAAFFLPLFVSPVPVV